jgi:hypothetical protein
MQGGGFQIYNTPTRRGYLHPTMIETLGQVADFCRARQAVSHKSTSVPQIALLLSTETQFDWSDRVFHYAGTTEPLEGTLHALLELAYSVDILAEHQLQPRMRDFPLIVVPDSYKLAEPFRRALLEYVEQGGGLLLLGDVVARAEHADDPAFGVAKRHFADAHGQDGSIGQGGELANVEQGQARLHDAPVVPPKGFRLFFPGKVFVRETSDVLGTT